MHVRCGPGEKPEINSKAYLSVCHAAAYAAVSLQTAYLKAHYPNEFYAGLLTSVMDDTKKLAPYITECKRNGIHILPPDINTSTEEFTVTEEGICYGLYSVKKAGKDIVKKIKKEGENRPYKDLYDFIERNPECNTGVIQNLIHAGAFDKIGVNRRTLANHVAPIINLLRAEKKTMIPGQLSLFDLFEEESVQNYTMETMKEYSKMELLTKEKEASGIYISGHPAECLDVIKEILFTDISRLEEITREKEVMIRGMIQKKHIVFTKNGNKKMCFLTLEDQTGDASIVVFPTQYESYGNILEENDLVIMKGKTSINEDDSVSVIADRLYKIPENTNLNRSVWIYFNSNEEFDQKIGGVIPLANAYHGILYPIRYQIGSNSHRFLNQYTDDLERFAEEAQKLLGYKNVKIWKR